MNVVSYDAWRRVVLAIGLACGVKVNEKARVPAYLIHLALAGDLKVKSSAQLRSNHEISEIVNAQMATVVNFPKKQIGPIMSDCLVTGVQRPDGDADAKRETTVFMTTFPSVEVGARVGILAERELATPDPRNLTWPEFACLDLRIGTLCKLINQQVADDSSHSEVVFDIDLGRGAGTTCAGKVQCSVSAEQLLGKQVLVLTNLDDETKRRFFHQDKFDAVLLTVWGMAIVTPAKPVANGFKLA